MFPEDTPVPAGFFNLVAPLLTDEKNLKKAKMAIGNSLSTPLKYNLIKGSLSTGHGVFMHDIVRVRLFSLIVFLLPFKFYFFLIFAPIRSLGLRDQSAL